MALYPINLKISDRLCIVVGGGSVACRKVQNLLDCGAVVRVVSPSVEAGLKKIILDKHVEWFDREYVEGDLYGAFLVFAATNNPDVQRQVKAEASEYKVLINSADDPGACDFHVPAYFRRGKMLVTVSTGGGSPALSKQIRERLEGEFGQEYEAVVDFLAMVRESVVSCDDDSSSHKELFQRLLQSDIVELIRDGNWFDLQMVLLQELPDEIDSVTLMKRFLHEHDKKKS